MDDLLRYVEGEGKINAGKSKVMILNGEERLVCGVNVYRTRLEHILEFKYLG